MDGLNPIERKEFFLAKLGGQEVTPPDAVTRIERYLQDIIDGNASTIPPITRIEYYLAKISGADVDVPDPATRTEYYLAKIAGMDVEPPDPITRLDYFLAQWVETGGGVLETVTGTAPITLANAIAKAIKSLTQTGLCTQADTPTPSAPVDIKCNNGELKMVHQSGLPSDYKLLEYVGGSGSQYIVTDLYLASTDVIECEYRNSSTTGYGAIYGIYKSGESSALYGNQTYYGYNEGNNKVDTGVSVDTDWHSSRHDFVNGTLTIDETTVNFTPWTFVNTTKNAVLTRFYNGSYGYHWKGYVRKFKVTRGGTVICDLLPAKDSNGDAGLYDLVSGKFYTASGGTLLEGNVVDDYYLAVVGTPEVLTVSASGATDQTATVESLLAVGSVADEQDLINGAVIRRCAVCCYDGTQAIGDVYMSTTGGKDLGATIVYPLDEPVTEQVTAQPLNTSEGTNTVSVTAEVSPIELEAEYMAVAP